MLVQQGLGTVSLEGVETLARTILDATDTDATARALMPLPYLPPSWRKPPICRGLLVQAGHIDPSRRAEPAWLCGSRVPEMPKFANGAVPVLSRKRAEPGNGLAQSSDGRGKLLGRVSE